MMVRKTKGDFIKLTTNRTCLDRPGNRLEGKRTKNPQFQKRRKAQHNINQSNVKHERHQNTYCKTTETNSTPKHSRTRTPENITDSRGTETTDQKKKTYLKHQDTSTGHEARSTESEELRH